MKHLCYFLTSILVFTLFSCMPEDNSLVNSEWESSDETMYFTFESQSICRLDLYLDPEDKTYKESATYTYIYNDPEITLTVPKGTGFNNYEGNISGDEMKIRIQNTTGEELVFYRVL